MKQGGRWETDICGKQGVEKQQNIGREETENREYGERVKELD